MVDKIRCTVCHKMNDIHKFCIYCGHKLLDDEQIRLILDNPEPYCLNCGRTVKKGKTKCECGYEFRIMDCPKCNSKNAYANRFCTNCGEKLWTSDVIIRDRFPQEIRNTIFYSRYKHGLTINFPGDFSKIGTSYHQLQSNKSLVEEQLSEIFSRWKIVSPYYCINCLSIMKPNEYRCKKCGTVLPYAEKRVDYIKNKRYSKPVFDRVELKWNSKFSENYLDSLAPAIGESQFEYRERLKWEFTENNNLKIEIVNAIIDLKKQIVKEKTRRRQAEEIRKREKERKRQAEEIQKREKERKRQAEERKKQEEEYIRQYGGGYCSSTCRHYYEEIITPHGISADYTDDMCGVDYYCSLGHRLSYGSYCKDYE